MQFRKRGLAIVSLSPTGFFAFEAAIDNTLWVGLISVILLLLATEQTWMNNLKQRTEHSESYFTDISSDIQLRPSDDKLRVARFPKHLFKRCATLRTMTKFWKKWVIRGITRNIIFRQNTNIALVNNFVKTDLLVAAVGVVFDSIPRKEAHYVKYLPKSEIGVQEGSKL